MPRKPTVKVNHETIAAVFDYYDIWDKIRDGHLLPIVLRAKETPSHHYPDAVSRIVKYVSLDNTHVATTHRIEDKDGNILHEDAKDIQLPNLIITRP